MRKWTTADIPSQAGRTAVVTGTGGLGLETALALARAGADTVVAGRSAEKGAEAVARISTEVPSARVRFEQLDLASLASVTAFATRLARRERKVDLLVNNAGVMVPPTKRETEDGFELQFGTNHLGHFALATGLHKSLAAADGARVAAVASIGHLFSPVVFDDLHYRFRPYDQWTSYGQSKSAIVLFAVGAAQRWADDGIAVNALMPGNIASTALARHMGPDDLANFGQQTDLTLPPVKTIEQGAATSVLVAASPDVEGVTGRYYEDCAVAPVVQERAGHTGGVAPYVLDANNAERLWQISEELTQQI